MAYKNRDDLAQCYAQLCAIPEIDCIVIVDNSYAEVGSCFDFADIQQIDARVIHAIPEGNAGYAAGNNFGIDVARKHGAEHVLICNPDVLISAETVSGLLSEMNSRALHLISPRLLEAVAGGGEQVVSNPGWDSILGKGVINIPVTPQASRYIPTFYGACFLASNKLFEQIGGLSEDFFLYGEEIDFTLRMDRSNLRWAISEEIVVSHDRGSSISPERSKSLVAFLHASRSTVIVGRKYWPRALIIWSAARVFYAGTLLLRGRPAESRAIISGLIQGFRLPIVKA